MADFMPAVETVFPRKITVQDDLVITMPDGCRLSARLWLPVDAHDNPVPVILEHLPYRKRDGTIVRDELTHPWMAGHGYACLRVDMRGNGDSLGLMEDEYTRQELQDACDVIAWAIAQPWCSGTAGMMGISWGGFNALQVAAMQPPALKAIITICSTVDRFADDIHYKGGCLLNANFSWASTMLAYSSRPPDPEIYGAGWRDAWLDRLSNMPHLAKTWMEQQSRGPYWQNGSVCEDYSAIKAAVLSIGGWHDGYRNTIAHLVENVEAPVKGIVGPWIHKYPHYAGPEPRIGFLQEAKRWWDYWLKGEPNGADDLPAYRAWLMDGVAPKRWYDERPGRWICEPCLPSPNVEFRSLALGGDNGAGVMRADAKISSPIEIASAMDCGLEAGEYFPFAYADEFPGDQAADDAKSVAFDGDVLGADLALLGAAEIALRLSCDQPAGLIAARLCDVAPDGKSTLIAHGFLNLMHRDGAEHPQRVEPSAIFDVIFKLDQCAYRLPAGHRLRLALSTQYWPFIWPSPQVATVCLHGGSLQLPVRTKLPDADEFTFEPPVGAPHWQHEVLRPGAYKRDVKRDGNKVTVKTRVDHGENRDAHHGLILGHVSEEAFEICDGDPLSARAQSDHLFTGGRGDWRWTSNTQMTLTADLDHFFITASLSVEENGETIFSKTWDDKVARRYV